MPELPEVETTRRGILPFLLGERVRRVTVRNRRLRWAVPERLDRELPGACFTTVERRGKYLLLRTERGTVIVHLGMSGSLRLVSPSAAPLPHDHVDLALSGGRVLRLRDPRRFGAFLWTRRDPGRHRLIARLGPEPFDGAFGGPHLHERARRRRTALRDFLLDGRVVAGIGNIYANEAAFRAGIDPRRAAGRISSARYERLAAALREVLDEAIALGGTTLRDFTDGAGRPGYFRAELAVYGRDDESCRRCPGVIRQRSLRARSLFFCPACQR